MNHFSLEEARKIQSVLDLFGKYFSFSINGKPLETLIVQGGMGVDTSTTHLAKAVSKTGSAGTIATTLSQKLDEIKNFTPDENIVGINNLVKVLDYEGNINYESKYKLGKQIGADYIFSGAGITGKIGERIREQARFLDKKHYWTIPIVSLVSQLQSYFKPHRKTGQHRQVGIICLENGDAGGHNHPHARSFEETLAEFKEAKIDKKGEKIIFAGKIRTPKDGVRVLDAGFDALQMGSLFLLSEEVNISDHYRSLVLHARKGDVANIVSPSGFPAKGFVDEGVMKRAMHGINSPKLSCQNDPEDGCFADCQHIQDSAKAINLKKPGDYCIKMALYQLHTAEQIYKHGPVYFCGVEPEKLFIAKQMKEQNKLALPAKTLIGLFLSGMYDSILASDGLQDEHRQFLEQRFTSYKKEYSFSGKILQEEKF